MTLYPKEEVDRFLPRTACWRKGFDHLDSTDGVSLAFSKISKRKKLLALIMLTDPENDRMPEIAFNSLKGGAGGFAWCALGWIAVSEQRSLALLRNSKLTESVRSCIQEARKMARCVDEMFSVLNAEENAISSLIIAQHGSLKQRIPLVNKLSKNDAEQVVLGSSSALVLQAIEWAKSVI